MYSFGLNIKNILLLKLSYLIVSSIIPSQLVYGYELCERKEECFYNEKFKKEISSKKNIKDTKNFDNFFNERDLNPLEIFLAFTNENSNQSSIKIEGIEQTENKENLIAEGDVIIKRNGAVLLTDNIEYDKNSKLLKSEGVIKFINKKFSLNWNKRAYNSQFYFEQHTENAGFKLKIFEPSFKGLG